MTGTMSKALEAAPLRDKLLLAISEVHSGNGAEGEQIADAVLSVIAHLAEDEAVVERVARALYAATPFKETAGGYDHQSDTYRRLCETLARAAIAAMRPTLMKKE